MRGLTIQYIIRRFTLFLLTIWLGATVLFIIPRLAPGDPTTAMLTRLRAQGTRMQNSETMIDAWTRRFGLDRPVHVQYLSYLANLTRFDLGYSLAYFPLTVSEMIAKALPWTVGLLTIATLLNFALGTTIGALMGWHATPGGVKKLLPFTLTFTSIPPFMLSILLIYLFGFVLKWFPISGGYERGLETGWSWEFIRSVVKHGVLPAASIVLVSMGFQALGMRGMMVTIHNEDYLVLAKLKGLSPGRVFGAYAVRNSILPQVTSLALGLGAVVGGATLVETLFSYPGMGYLMYRAITSQDYSLIAGIGFIMIATTATAVFLLDMLYPSIDPRITYKKR